MKSWRLVRWLDSPVPLALVESLPGRGAQVLGFRSVLREVRQAGDGWRWWESTEVRGHSKPVNYAGKRVPPELEEALDMAMMGERVRRGEVRRA